MKAKSIYKLGMLERAVRSKSYALSNGDYVGFPWRANIETKALQAQKKIVKQ